MKRALKQLRAPLPGRPQDFFNHENIKSVSKYSLKIGQTYTSKCHLPFSQSQNKIDKIIIYQPFEEYIQWDEVKHLLEWIFYLFFHP